MSLTCTLLVSAVLATAPALVGSGDDARAWLDRMGEALESLNYEGTFVHMHDGEPETLKIVHRVSGDRISERLVSLDGVGREIIRNNDEVKCVLRDERTVVVERRPDKSPLRDALPRNSDDLATYYDIVFERDARVIQRDAKVVVVRPRDSFRYGYRLWLDIESGLPLRSDLVNEAGDVVERVLFTNLTVGGTISDADLLPTVSADEGFTWIVDGDVPATVPDESAHWEAADLPPGFRLSVSDRKRLLDQGSEVEHHVYTDGLASVSVFVETRTPGESPMEGLSTMGAANAYATTIKNFQVTVVGEVPVDTVKRIGHSLQPRSPKR